MNQPINPSPYNEVVDATTPDGVTLSCEIPNTDDTIDSTVFVLYNETDKTAVSLMEDKSKREINEAGNLCVSVNTTEIENGKDYSWRLFDNDIVKNGGKPIGFDESIKLSRTSPAQTNAVYVASNNSKAYEVNDVLKWSKNLDVADDGTLITTTEGEINFGHSHSAFNIDFDFGVGDYIQFYYENIWTNKYQNKFVFYASGTVKTVDGYTIILEMDFIDDDDDGYDQQQIRKINVFKAGSAPVLPDDFLCIDISGSMCLNRITQVGFNKTDIVLTLDHPLSEPIESESLVWLYRGTNYTIDYGESPYYYFSTAETPEFYVRNVWDAANKDVLYNPNLNNIFDVTIGDKTIMQSLKYNIYKTNQDKPIISSPVIYNKNETHWCCYGLNSNEKYTIEAVLTTKNGQKVVSTKLLCYISDKSALNSVTATFLTSKDEINTRCVKISGFNVLDDKISEISKKITDTAYDFNIDIFREDLTDGKIEYAGMLRCAVNFPTGSDTITTGLSGREFYDYNIKCGHKYKYYVQPSFFNANRYMVVKGGFTETTSSIIGAKSGDVWIATNVTDTTNGFYYYVNSQNNYVKIPAIYVRQSSMTDFYTTSNEVTPTWDSWRISSLILDDNVDNKFYVDPLFSWDMPLNFEPSAIQYNNGKAYTERFSKYPLINKGYSGYLQGSIKFLYGDEEILCKTGEYSNPSIIREKWIEFVDGSDYKLLSDTHGHNMIVDISNLSFEYDETVIGAPMYISFEYIQVADTENVIITGV